MDINSLPPVSGSQIQAMNRAAEQMMAADGMQEVSQVPQEQVEQEQQPQEIETSAQEQPVQEQPRSDRKTPAESFKELRDKAERNAREVERVAKERDEYAQRLYEYEKSLKQSQSPQQQQEEPDFNINPDDLVEGKHLKTVYKEVHELKKQLQRSQQEAMLANAEARIKSQYHDFDKVVSQENLQLLSYTYPELANTINSSNDIYSKAVSAYMMIKQTGIYKENTFDAEKKRIQENSLKPRLAPASNVTEGDTPLSKANLFSGELTPELKKQLAKEMFEARHKM